MDRCFQLWYYWSKCRHLYFIFGFISLKVWVGFDPLIGNKTSITRMAITIAISRLQQCVKPPSFHYPDLKLHVWTCECYLNSFVTWKHDVNLNWNIYISIYWAKVYIFLLLQSWYPVVYPVITGSVMYRQHSGGQTNIYKNQTKWGFWI